MPILIIGGRYDRVAVPTMMVKYKNYCPQAKFVLFEHSGHNPQVEEPEKEFKIIREFLSEINNYVTSILRLLVIVVSLTCTAYCY